MSSFPALVSTKGKIFFVESNVHFLEYLQSFISDQYDLSTFCSEDALFSQLARGDKPDILVLPWFGIEQSTGVIARLIAEQPSIPLLITTCGASVKELAVIVRLGVSGVIHKPFYVQDLEAVIEQQLTRVTATSPDEIVETDLGDNSSFVRSSKRMREIELQASLVARSDIPVLILGESGSGKEVLAKYIHAMSSRNKKIFLKVNCAAMPAELLESELFGYEQGAFTGAIKAKPGKFEICDGGTIFLDEIGEMAAVLQAKLLHVLQDGIFSRLGGRSPMKADVRVIAATNINMKEAMAQKAFREDLYYRLNGFSFTIPPLRERTEEIVHFARFFMQRAATKYDRLPLSLSPSLLTALTQYKWPGNLRELENVINRYLVMGDERSILSELALRNTHTPIAANVPGELKAGGLKQLVRSLKGDAEASAIANALEGTKWNRKAAAVQMQISYKALLYKIKQYDLAR